MGWSYSCNPAHNKQYQINQWRTVGFLSPGYTYLEDRVVGNNFWYLYSRPDGTKTIGLNLMKGGGKNSGWGYKGISEDMGPTEVNCPLALLDKADSPQGYAIEWREKVRKYHADKAARPKLVAGMIVKYFGADYRLLRPRTPSGWIVECLANDRQYSMSPHRLARSAIVCQN